MISGTPIEFFGLVVVVAVTGLVVFLTRRQTDRQWRRAFALSATLLVVELVLGAVSLAVLLTMDTDRF